MILNDKIKIIITNRNITHYKSIYNDIKVGENIIDIKNLKSGSDVKILISCDNCAKEFNKKFNNLNRDRENNGGFDYCGDCGRIKSGQTRKLNFETIYNLFLSKNLTPKFNKNDTISTNIKLPYVCNIHNDNTQFVKYSKLIDSNYCCKLCRSKRLSEINIKKFSEVEKYFIKRGLIPLFKEFDISGIFEKLKFKCKIHDENIQEISYSSLKNTKEGCKICFSIKGENSWNWKGGITPLTRNMRSKIDIYIKSKIKESNYTCELTGLNGTVHYHHIINFHLLLEESLKINNYDIKKNISDYTPEELYKIEKNLIKLNENSPYVILISKIHILFHKIYGKKNNNEEQYNEFKIRYKNCEFNNILPIKYRYYTKKGLSSNEL
jgi:hypothetical protein